MTRLVMMVGVVAVLAGWLVLAGNALLLGYAVAAASLAILVGLVAWSVVSSIRHSDFVLKKLASRPAPRPVDTVDREEGRRAA